MAAQTHIVFRADDVRVTWSAARSSHRIQWRDTDGTRRSIWRSDGKDAVAEAEKIATRLAMLQGASSNRSRKMEDLVAYTLNAEYNDRALDWTPSTLTAHRSVFLAWVLPRIGQTYCYDLTVEMLAGIVADAKRAGKKDNTIRNIANTLYVMVEAGRTGDFLDKTFKPEKGEIYKRPKGGARRKNKGMYVDPKFRPHDEDVDRLAEHLRELFPAEPWWALMCLLCGYAGLRTGEALALEARDINFDEGVIRVERQVRDDGIDPDDEWKRHVRNIRPPKYGSIRETILPPHLEDALRRRCEEVGFGKPLFPAANGSHAHAGNFTTRRAQPAMDRAGGGWAKDPAHPEGKRLWTWHSLRHHFATWALRPSPDGLGLSVAEVADFMGHGSPSVTLDTYVGSQEGAAKRAREQVRKWQAAQKGEAA